MSRTTSPTSSSPTASIPDRLIPSIHHNYSPTFDIQAGDPDHVQGAYVQHDSRTGNLGLRRWHAAGRQFSSDGNAVKLDPDGYAETVHRYKEPGDYVVRVERTNEFGVRAVGQLHVRIAESHGRH